MDWLLLLACLTLAGFLWGAATVLLGFRKIQRLRDLSAAVPDQVPLVSIIIPALNEEEGLEPALRSVLALDYPALEIIAVDDRSTDATGSILDRLAGEFPQLQVIHIRELPPGWLGKNHALWLGAAQARGELLLFTDADVRMEKSALARAVGYLSGRRLDHLAVFFDAVVPGGLLNMLIVDFAGALLLALRPWEASDPGKGGHIGVGGFNLIRAETYQRIGSHQALALCPVDDVMLGWLVKRRGGRQDCLLGRSLITVPWYGSVGEMIRGLEKNIFAFCDYSLPKVAGGSLLIVLGRIWPLAALLCTSGPTRLVNLALVALQLLLTLAATRNSPVAARHLLWFPLSPIPGLYLIWRATFLALWRRGIRWRTTFYPLAELRAFDRALRGR
jgi:glycosyltransferase involved in cell wall biosynthesis